MAEIALHVLANSVWVGCAAAGFAALGCLILRDASARHGVCFFALAAAAGIPVLQLFVPNLLFEPNLTASGAPPAAMDAFIETGGIVPLAPDWDLGLLLWIWACGALGFFALLAWRVIRALRVKRATVPAPAGLLARRAQWQSNMPHGRDGALLSSRLAASPFAVGWLSPAVVFPEAVEQHLGGDDLKRLWLHEAAHLRRFDDWTALAAELCGAILFFHPAAWWLRARIAAEREFACDEAAARFSGSAAEYAFTLTRVAELRLQPNVSGELGIAGGPNLDRRIRMLFQHCRSGGSRRAAGAFGVAGFAVAALLVCGPKASVAQKTPPAPKPAPEVSVNPPAPSPLPAPAPVVEVEVPVAPAASVKPAAIPPSPAAPAAPTVPAKRPVPANSAKIESGRAGASRVLLAQAVPPASAKSEASAPRARPEVPPAVPLEEMFRELRENEREIAEQVRRGAERIRESMVSVYTVEMQRQLRDYTKHMELQSEWMKAHAQQLGAEMRRLEERLGPQMEQMERQFRETFPAEPPTKPAEPR